MNEIFEVLAERKYGKQNFRSLAVKTEQNSGGKASDFKSPGRAEERKLNFISLAVKEEQKCGSGTSQVLRSRQR